jgi:hypothetical protein
MQAVHNFLFALNMIGIIGGNTISVNDSFWHEPQICLAEIRNSSLRFLEYPNGSLHTLSIPYPAWSSIQILAHINQILLSEVMQYDSKLYQVDSFDDSEVVRYMVACIDTECVQKDVDNPKIHLSLETWATGIQFVSNLQEVVRPTFASTLGYAGVDFLFLWQDTVEAGLNSPERTILNHYHAYNSKLNQPAKFFDRWEKILELVPADLILPCSMVYSDGDNFNSEKYKSLTNDTGGCSINDSVWFSPACRLNVSECVPVVMQYYTSVASQLAFFHHMPMAIVTVGSGENNYFEYYDAVQRGHFLFGYWWPNDRPVDQRGRVPEQLIFPRANLL